MAGVASSSRQRSKIAPYLMVLPALAYLAIFFVVPFFSLARTSLSETAGSVFMPTLTFAWDFGNYAEAFTLYREQIFRSFGYALAATVLCLLLFVGAIRLSRPHAPWARWRYTNRPRKMHRALERERWLRRPVIQAKLWLQDAISGMPKFPDDKLVDQELDREIHAAPAPGKSAA